MEKNNVKDYALEMLELYKKHKIKFYENSAINKFYEERKDSYIYRYYFKTIKELDEKNYVCSFTKIVSQSQHSKHGAPYETKVENSTIDIKVSKAKLASVRDYKEVLINYFAEEIILFFSDPRLIPAWLWKKMYDSLIEYIPIYYTNERQNRREEFEKEIYECDSLIDIYKYDVLDIEEDILKLKKKISKYEAKLLKKRKEKLANKVNLLKEKVTSLENEKEVKEQESLIQIKIRNEVNEKYNKDLVMYDFKEKEELELCKMSYKSSKEDAA
jgi:hypothetical protein